MWGDRGRKSNEDNICQPNKTQKMSKTQKTSNIQKISKIQKTRKTPEYKLQLESQ